MLKVGDYFGENALLRDESGTSKGSRFSISYLTVKTENGKKGDSKIHQVISRILFDV